MTGRRKFLRGTIAVAAAAAAVQVRRVIDPFGLDPERVNADEPGELYAGFVILPDLETPVPQYVSQPGLPASLVPFA